MDGAYLLSDGSGDRPECGSFRRGHNVKYSPGGPCFWCEQTTPTALLEYNFVNEWHRDDAPDLYHRVRDILEMRWKIIENSGKFLCLSMTPSWIFEKNRMPYGIDFVAGHIIANGPYTDCDAVRFLLQFCDECLPILQGSVPDWEKSYWPDGVYKYLCIGSMAEYEYQPWRTVGGKHCEKFARQPHWLCEGCMEEYSNLLIFDTYFYPNGCLKAEFQIESLKWTRETEREEEEKKEEEEVDVFAEQELSQLLAEQDLLEEQEGGEQGSGEQEAGDEEPE